jgi:NADH-quinone oxidoreductase subunit G
MLPDDIARVGFLAAALLEGETEAVESSDEPVRIAAERIAGDLADSARPVIVSGTGSGHAGVIRAAAALAHALKKSGKDAKLYFALPGCNALGLVMLGGGSITEAVQRVEEGAAETVLALETDLYRALPLESAQRLMSSTRVFAMDALRTRTMDEAATAMAVGTFADSDGTLVNNEGRAQRFFQVTAPVHGIRESRRCIAEIALCMIQDCPQEQLPTGEARRVLDALAQCSVMDDFLRLTVQAFPVFKGIEEAAPSSHYRVRGMRIARQSHRYSGRTAMNAQRDVHEHKPPRDVDSPLAFSMEGYQARPESALIPRFWAPHWNSDQSLNKFQDEVGGRLKGGNPGKRLIEPLPDAEIERSPFSPESGPVDSNEFLFAPMHEIFGSEELSAYSEPLASLIPAPYVILNSADAKERGWKEGVVLHAHISGRVVQVTLRTSPDIPRGAAGLSVGLPGLPSIELPAKGALEAATEAYR